MDGVAGEQEERKMKDTGLIAAIGGIAALVFIVVGICYGYIHNIYMLCNDDFKAPYKAEIIRGVGIVVPPVGWIAGYVTFEKEEKSKP